MKLTKWLRKVVEQLRRRETIETIVEDKLPSKEVRFSKEAPRIGKPYVPKDYPNTFYEYDPELSNCVAGYKKGTHNPYLEKLMKL